MPNKVSEKAIPTMLTANMSPRAKIKPLVKLPRPAPMDTDISPDP
jgi:hypothetical protein